MNKTEAQIIQEELAKHGITPNPIPKPVVKTIDVTTSKEIEVTEQTADAKEVERLIKSAGKPKKVTITLNNVEIEALTREARTLDISWKVHLTNLVQELLSQRVGKTTIQSTSWGKKISSTSSNKSSTYLS